LGGSGRLGRRRSGRRTRRRAPVAEEEDGVLGVDSARLRDVLGVQEEEGEAAFPFPCSVRHGSVRVVASFKLRRRPWRCSVGEKQRGEETAAARED
jgi:hypothetical protein